MVGLVYDMKKALLSSDLTLFAELLDYNWSLKRTLVEDISNDKIEDLYQTAKRNGALGGKLLGAGGTGFMLFYCESDNQEKLVASLEGCRQLPFKFSNSGSMVIHAEQR